MTTPQPAKMPDHGRARMAAQTLLEATSDALRLLQDSWDPEQVASWTEEVVACKGRVVLCGMGKSGLVAQKIAATFASTGCPSFYLHPGEALHGDIGMVTEDDAILLLSNSGETDEVISLIPSILRMKIPTACITSNPQSRMAKASKWCFGYRLPKGEGCPLNFAPMASTTLQLVWGDLLNAYRMAYSQFALETFARLHPAGNIGARLLLVEDLIHKNPPEVHPEDSFVQVLQCMSQGKLGMTMVTQASRLTGVISDGDLRRAMERCALRGTNPLDLKAEEVMTAQPICIPRGTPAIEAARLMEQRKITFLVVEGEAGRPGGVLHIHDLLEAKVI